MGLGCCVVWVGGGRVIERRHQQAHDHIPNTRIGLSVYGGYAEMAFVKGRD